VTGSRSFDEKCVYVIQQLTNDPGRFDYIFHAAIEDMKRDDALSEDVLDAVIECVRMGLVRNQKSILRHSFKSRRGEKILKHCQYVSLWAEGVPRLSFIDKANIIKAADEGVPSLGIISAGERVGAAHAFVALTQYRQDARLKLIRAGDFPSQYPELIRLFAANVGKAGAMHSFIAERILNLDDESDVACLREFAASESPALAGGSL
jgi:hypothetical protein